MDPDVDTALRYYTYYLLGRGNTRADAMMKTREQMGLPFNQRWQDIATQVATLAQRGESVARAIETARDADPDNLLALVAGLTPDQLPHEEVAVRVIATFPDGRVRSAVVRAGWYDTVQSVFDRAAAYLADSVPGAGAEDIIWSVRGPTLAPSRQAM